MRNLVFAILLSMSLLAHAELPLAIKLSTKPGEKAERISITLKNVINSTVHVKSVSIEQLDAGKWVLLAYDIKCPCLAKCNSVAFSLEPKKELNLVFDFHELGCGQAARGVQYRAIAQGGWDAASNARTMLGESNAIVAKE